jgi:hypothetical protein
MIYFGLRINNMIYSFDGPINIFTTWLEWILGTFASSNLVELRVEKIYFIPLDKSLPE